LPHTVAATRRLPADADPRPPGRKGSPPSRPARKLTPASRWLLPSPP